MLRHISTNHNELSARNNGNQAPKRAIDMSGGGGGVGKREN